MEPRINGRCVDRRYSCAGGRIGRGALSADHAVIGCCGLLNVLSAAGVEFTCETEKRSSIVCSVDQIAVKSHCTFVRVANRYHAVEGAFIDWSAVFMRSVLDASPLLISITYSFFSIVMAAVRLSGDKIRDLFSEQLIVQVSGIAAAAGIALFAMAPNVFVAFLGAALSGMGVAIVYPLAITAAAGRPGRSSADNVAAITMISFSAFLFAPPAIGFLSEIFSLRIALLCLAPLALITFLLSAEINPVSDSEENV